MQGICKLFQDVCNFTNVRESSCEMCICLFQPEMNVNISGDFCFGSQTNSDSSIWSLPSNVEWLADYAKAVWLPPSGWSQQRSHVVLEFTSRCVHAFQCTFNYNGMSPFPKWTRKYKCFCIQHCILGHSKCEPQLEEISGCLEHSFPDRRGLLPLSVLFFFFFLFFLCFFTLSKDFLAKTTRDMCSWYEPSWTCWDYFALQQERLPTMGNHGHLMKRFSGRTYLRIWACVRWLGGEFQKAVLRCLHGSVG